MNRCVLVVAIALVCMPSSELPARTWSDASGKYRVEAELVAFDDNVVQLRKADNSIVFVPMSKLSDGDRKFLASLFPAIKPGDAVITIERAPLKIEDQVLAQIAPQTRLVAQDVQGSWAAVSASVGQRNVEGWLHLSHLIPASSDPNPAPPPSEPRPQQTDPAPAKIEHVSEADFDQRVLKSDVPVLVDFTAEWCGPCKALAPLLEEVAHEAADTRIVKVDIDRNRTLAVRYGIRAIPALIVFNGGAIISRQQGLIAKERILSMFPR